MIRALKQVYYSALCILLTILNCSAKDEAQEEILTITTFFPPHLSFAIQFNVVNLYRPIFDLADMHSVA